MLRELVYTVVSLTDRVLSEREVIPMQESQGQISRCPLSRELDQISRSSSYHDNLRPVGCLCCSQQVHAFPNLSWSRSFAVSVRLFSLSFICFCFSWGSFSAMIRSTTFHDYEALQKLNIDNCFKDNKESCLELTWNFLLFPSSLFVREWKAAITWTWSWVFTPMLNAQLLLALGMSLKMDTEK